MNTVVVPALKNTFCIFKEYGKLKIELVVAYHSYMNEYDFVTSNIILIDGMARRLKEVSICKATDEGFIDRNSVIYENIYSHVRYYANKGSITIIEPEKFISERLAELGITVKY